MKDCPTLTARGREAEKSSLSGPDLDALNKNCFYALQTSKEKEDNPYESTSTR